MYISDTSERWRTRVVNMMLIACAIFLFRGCVMQGELKEVRQSQITQCNIMADAISSQALSDYCLAMLEGSD